MQNLKTPAETVIEAAAGAAAYLATGGMGAVCPHHPVVAEDFTSEYPSQTTIWQIKENMPLSRHGGCHWRAEAESIRSP